MKLVVQKRLAAGVLKGSRKRICFDVDRLEEIKEAITKADIRGLVKDRAVHLKPVRGISRVRAKKVHLQKKKGRRKGHGSRKGKSTARSPKKKIWMQKIRLQRAFLRKLKEKGLLDKKSYKDLYAKAKGGFFRSKRHMKLYVAERSLVNEYAKEK